MSLFVLLLPCMNFLSALGHFLTHMEHERRTKKWQKKKSILIIFFCSPFLWQFSFRFFFSTTWPKWCEIHAYVLLLFFTQLKCHEICWKGRVGGFLSAFLGNIGAKSRGSILNWRAFCQNCFTIFHSQFLISVAGQLLNTLHLGYTLIFNTFLKFLQFFFKIFIKCGQIRSYFL